MHKGNKFIGVFAAVSMVVGIQPAFAEDVFKLGVIQPQAGECAQWGVPVTRATQLWAEELNEAGGIETKDGKRHKIEVTAYDNGCYAAGEELKAARRAVLDDGVKYISQTYTPASRQAIGPLSAEANIMSIAYGAGFLSAKYPLIVGAITGSPQANMLGMSYLIEKQPDIKRIAILTANVSYGNAAKVYMDAGVAAHADKAEVVYTSSYDPSAASDMLSLLTPVIEAQPDLIYELGFIPSQKAVLIATADQLGYKGKFASEDWSVPFLKEQGVMESAAGRIFAIMAVDGSEPTFSPRAHEFYKRYTAKYGAAEWVSNASMAYSTAAFLEAAVKASPTIDPVDVAKSVYAMSEVEHPIYGKSQWSGEEIYGVKHQLLTPTPVYGFEADGTVVLDGVIDTHAWWEKNKAAAIPVIKNGGQAFVE